MVITRVADGQWRAQPSFGEQLMGLEPHQWNNYLGIAVRWPSMIDTPPQLLRPTRRYWQATTASATPWFQRLQDPYFRLPTYFLGVSCLPSSLYSYSWNMHLRVDFPWLPSLAPMYRNVLALYMTKVVAVRKYLPKYLGRYSSHTLGYVSITWSRGHAGINRCQQSFGKAWFVNIWPS